MDPSRTSTTPWSFVRPPYTDPAHARVRRFTSSTPCTGRRGSFGVAISCRVEHLFVGWQPSGRPGRRHPERLGPASGARSTSTWTAGSRVERVQAQDWRRRSSDP